MTCSMRVSSGQEKYVDQTFGLRDPDLDRIRAELDARGVEFMSISSAEGRILQFLVRGFGMRKIVEVGALFGYSALCMAKALPADGVVYALEKNPENARIASELLAASPDGGKIRLMQGDARQILREIEADGPFDMVFIDADKAAYPDYLDWAEKNVRRGGLIVGDNTFLFGALWGESRDSENSERRIQAMTEFNRRLADPRRFNSTIIPTYEGMTVAQKL